MNHVADIEALKRDLREAMTRALVQFRLLETQIRLCRESLRTCDSIIGDARKLKDESK